MKTAHSHQSNPLVQADTRAFPGVRRIIVRPHLMAKSQIRECYSCSAPGLTDEHIPPRCFFPKAKHLPPGTNYRKELITVPSCEMHNSSKSKDDEYILYILTMNLDSSHVGTNHFAKQVIRSIEQSPRLVNRMLSEASPALIKQKNDEEAWETVTVPIQTERVDSFFKQLGRGLFLHHFGQKWLADILVYPEFLRYPYEPDPTVPNGALQDLINAADLLFRKEPCYGDNPDVFKYQFHSGDSRFSYIARLHFYGSSRVILFYSPYAA